MFCGSAALLTAKLRVCAQSFEALNQRAVAVVVDPIQSVKGKVVIDAFRSVLLLVSLIFLHHGCPMLQ